METIKCILDTNILIQLEEPDVSGRFKEGFAELAELCHKYGVRVFYHPSSRGEVESDPIPLRKAKALEWLKKYPTLEHAPIAEISTLEELFGRNNNSNDIVDSQILYSIKRNAADYLISQDDRLRSRASRAGLSNRTFSILEFQNFLKKLYEPEKVFIPNILETRTYSINRTDPILNSIRDRYGPEKFEVWLNKCDKEERITWIVKDNEALAALVIVKEENALESKVPELAGRILKVCTFKVDDDHRGGKLGELLLKQILNYSTKNQFDHVYMTFYAEQDYLSIFLKDFGFKVSGKLNENGEFVYYKQMSVPASDEPKIDPVDFHITYSPWHYFAPEIKKYIVPIIPKYHEILFPELYSQQLSLPFASKGSVPGNTIKKVYLCNSPKNFLENGSIVFFYCSREAKILTSVGIVESSTKTSDLSECMRIIGKRSVYGLDDVEEMASQGVLIIDFRLAYHLSTSIPYSTLLSTGIIKGPTVSVTSVPEDRFKKLQKHLQPFYGHPKE
jgi:predicted GNAT family N-acyltransferase